jgi:anaerobic magnesium-protoporphyrin IX monomethyl ester cyclase
MERNRLKVTLVFPTIRNYGGFNSLGVNPLCVWVNHGLSSLAASLKEKGHIVKLIDVRECSSWEDYSIRLRLTKPDFVGVYMTTMDFVEANIAGEIARRLGYTTIVGGPHPSIVPGSIPSNSFDYVFVGEGEVTFPEVVENPGRFDRIIIGERPNLDLIPFEDRTIWNLDKIFRTWNRWRQPIINVISGRGCPYNCSFCKPGEDLIFGKFRMRSIDNFWKEIEMLHEQFKFNTLMIDDDAFTIRNDYVLEFCKRFKELDKSFVCQTRADFVARNEDIVKQMKESGLEMFIIGFESGSQRILNLFRKGTTVEINKKAGEVCKRQGVKIWANYMLGNPTETKEEAEATYKMITDMKPDVYSPAFYTPIVGTDLFEFCKKNDLLLIESNDYTALGDRRPFMAKIKDQDYEYLSKFLLFEDGRRMGK